MKITEYSLDPDQRAALDLALSGRNIFVTGAAGSGKSALMAVLLDKFVETGHSVVVTASTGIAALNVGGRTIHSFLGTQIAANVRLAGFRLKELEEKEPGHLDSIKWRLGRTDVIIIDEISMLSGDFVDMLDWWLRELLSSTEPFAGKQIVFVGDFFQLPPVIKREDRVERDIAFKALAWRAGQVTPVILTHNHRQANDRNFKDALDSLRSGDLSAETRAFFAKCVGRALKEPTVLFPTNKQVAHLNKLKLDVLPGKSYSLHASFRGPGWACKQLARISFVDVQIELKDGASVILARNTYNGVTGEEIYVNGDRGTVVERVGKSIAVKLERGGIVDVKREKFSIQDGDGKEIASMIQHPLKLAYALSIHKSQGLTLSRVRCDLGRCFADGQAYTALSRARNARGLSLAGHLSRRSVFANQDCVKFYAQGGRVRFIERRAV